MKINFTFTDNEIHECIDMITEIGVNHDDVMDMTDDFKIGGTNLKMEYTSYDKNLHIEINEKIIVKILARINPMISSIKSIVHTIIGLFDELDEYFDDVKLIDSWSKRNKELSEASIKRLIEEDEMLRNRLKIYKIKPINIESNKTEEFLRDYEYCLLYNNEITEEDLLKCPCTHKEKDGVSALIRNADGTVTCSICKAIFKPFDGNIDEARRKRILFRNIEDE